MAAPLLLSSRTSSEMTEVASDQHSEEVIKKVREYDIITDRPSRHRSANNKPSDSNRPNRSTWTTGTSRHDMPLTFSPTHQTNYQTVEDISNVQYHQRHTDRHSTMISDGDIIDGMSMSYNEEDGFVAIDVINNDMSIAKALDMCTKYVLRPYNVFLKIIGWRAFHSAYGDSTPCYKKCLNIIYPTFIFLMLIFTSLGQVASCFSRSQATPPDFCNDSSIPGFNCSDYSICDDGCYLLDCKKHLITRTVIGDVIILISYLWGFVFFRFLEKEHLSRLIQTTFLSCNSRMVKYSSKRLVSVILTFLVVGVAWIVGSLGASILRIFALRLDRNNTVIGWIVDLNPEHLQNEQGSYNYPLTIISLIGFVFFDLLYIAVVINYATQCQLLHFYIRNMKEKVRTKAYGLNYAIKELYHINEYLRLLNGQISYIMSFILFVFLQGLIFSYMDLMQVQSCTCNYINIVVGVLNIIQWLTAVLFPLVQSTRLTAECNGIRKLGLEIGARPFVYSDTPQLVLDSFVLYTSSTNYKAKLAFVPMYPSLVCGFIFFFGLYFTLDDSVTNFRFASWI